MTAESEVLPLTERAAQAFEAYRHGEPDLLPPVVEELTPMLWHVARSQGLGVQSAEDVVQHTWLQLLESAECIQDPRAVLKWLLTTTRREAWRVGRAARRETTHAEVGELPVADAAYLTSGEPADPVSDQVIAHHEHQVLWRHVAALSERCRHLLRVIAFADRPDYAAIASALGMPVGSIGPTRGRCLASLRAALSREPSYPTGNHHDAP
ncbi:RNA polymerase sigma factor [Ornithinimicrobium sufpigmenti]|uniref:RNA polymerase sigma factor n=1 Tax=Ornithinimicrobium sufpigmenti TaxID=2508882 RepID=UPI001EDE15AD|nr:MULTISPECIES: sigma-70 family RNA polymerase sigma factor [unclassified Ornithinimicrobium]